MAEQQGEGSIPDLPHDGAGVELPSHDDQVQVEGEQSYADYGDAGEAYEGEPGNVDSAEQGEQGESLDQGDNVVKEEEGEQGEQVYQEQGETYQEHHGEGEYAEEYQGEQQQEEYQGEKQEEYTEGYQDQNGNYQEYQEGQYDQGGYTEGGYQYQYDQYQDGDMQMEGDPSNTYNVYVGGLGNDVTEKDLMDAFQICGPVLSSRIFRDPSGEPMGYGFVHFETREGQLRALSEEYNRIKIKGKQTLTKPAVEKTTLFVGNLPTHLKESEVQEVLTNIVGPIQQLTLKTGPPPDCSSRGFCFVQFDSHHAANRAFKTLSRSPVQGKPLRVGWAESKPSAEEEQVALAETTTLFVNNLGLHVTEEQLRGVFGKFGELLKARIITNPHTNQSRGFAFVEYRTKEQSDSAVTATNNTEFGGGIISVIRARPDTRTIATASDKSRPHGGGPLRGSRSYDGILLPPPPLFF
jgi:RNA recognition motif-containing protein